MVMEMSKTYQYRKVMKPLLERKRRARINKCLDDLKDLMVECLQQEGEHVTRLEKADILELTVEHMRKLKQRGGLSLQQQQIHPAATSAQQVESFRSGYVHAADQITQVLLQQQQTDEIGGKIMKFLSTRLIEIQHQLQQTTTATTINGQLPTSLAYQMTSSSALSPSSVRTTTPPIPPRTILSVYGLANSNYNQLHHHNQHHSHQYFSKDNNELIDVTTIDNSSRDATASVSSSDSSSAGSEPVWRPW